MSTRTQPLRIVVSPVRVDDEYLRVYEFGGEQDEAVPAMRLKIELHGDQLTLIRARPDNGLFEEEDEASTLM